MQATAMYIAAPDPQRYVVRNQVTTRGDSLNRVEAIRNVAFALLGAMGLVFRDAYQGPLAEIVHSYGGNFVVSFALYFAVVSATIRLGLGRPAAVAATLLTVEVFELTDGFAYNIIDKLCLKQRKN